jgi:hypothetical protein
MFSLQMYKTGAYEMAVYKQNRLKPYELARFNKKIPFFAATINFARLR